MRVYRFQHKMSGWGPLCARTSFEWHLWIVSMSYPHEDSNFRNYYDKLDLDIAEAHYFGYNCLDKLFNVLLPGGDIALIEDGFELVEFEVTENYCVLADGQVFFNRGTAKRIA